MGSAEKKTDAERIYHNCPASSVLVSLFGVIHINCHLAIN